MGKKMRNNTILRQKPWSKPGTDMRTSTWTDHKYRSFAPQQSVMLCDYFEEWRIQGRIFVYVHIE
jgi:hypothetical protein